MPVPLIPALPTAPSRLQAAPNYAVTADIWAGAIGPWTDKVNILGDYVEQRAIDADASADNANDSKIAAAQSATDATDNGAEQVELAVTAKNQAVAAKDQAITAKDESVAAAIASGAAAGLPPERVPFSVLQINEAGVVGWGYGLPDRAAAQAGYSLILGAGKIPTWGFAGDQIGDLIATARNPGTLYLPANGTVYLQSAYPALFALVGLIGNPAGSVWTYVAAASSTTYTPGIDTDGNGVWVRGKKRSIDNGVTWTDLTGNGGSLDGFQAIVYGGGQVWMATDASTIFKSIDNGITWTVAKSSVGGGNSPQLATDKNGTWIFTSYNNVTIISKDNGVTWGSNIASSLNNPQGACFIGNNTWITPTGYRSVNGGLNWALYGTPGGNSTAFAAMCYLGNNIVLLMTTGQTRRSIDGGFSWSSVGAIGAAINGCSITHDGSGRVVIVGGITYLLSSDYGITWQTLGQPAGTGVMAFGAYGQNKFIVSSVNGYTPSVETFDYDKLTQFKTPSPVKVQGVEHYIKAKELA